MATSIIDGTIASTTLKRASRGVAILTDVVFDRDDGQQQILPRIVAAAPVAALLQPGVRGRFYVYHAIDHRGIHGVRTADGRQVYAHGVTNEIIMAAVAGINLALVIGFVMTGRGIPLLMTVLSIFGSVGFFLFWNTRMEARSQFEADAGFLPSARPPTRPASAS